MDKLPNFIYQPNVFELGIIKEKKISCPVCIKDREYTCSKGIYAIEEVPDICPWCVADGSAAKKYDGMFIDDMCCEKVPDQAKLLN